LGRVGWGVPPPPVPAWRKAGTSNSYSTTRGSLRAGPNNEGRPVGLAAMVSSSGGRRGTILAGGIC